MAATCFRMSQVFLPGVRGIMRYTNFEDGTNLSQLTHYIFKQQIHCNYTCNVLIFKNKLDELGVI